MVMNRPRDSRNWSWGSKEEIGRETKVMPSKSIAIDIIRKAAKLGDFDGVAVDSPVTCGWRSTATFGTPSADVM